LTTETGGSKTPLFQPPPERRKRKVTQQHVWLSGTAKSTRLLGLQKERRGYIYPRYEKRLQNAVPCFHEKKREEVMATPASERKKKGNVSIFPGINS